MLTWDGVAAGQHSSTLLPRIAVLLDSERVTSRRLRSRVSTPYQIHEDNIRTGEVVGFIRHLRKQLRRPLIICWDRWSVHRSTAKQIGAPRLKHVDFEFLPAYAAELNPTEALWSHTKNADLANFVPDDVRHLKRSVRSSLKRQANGHRLKQSFFTIAQRKLDRAL